MNNRKLEVTLETVTPMFLAGANDKKPELRPPSVRGQLRYWLRAALGAVVGDDLAALKRAEAEVFGDTDGTGAVGVRVIQPNSNLETDRFNPLPHKSKMGSFTGFKEGQRFQIQLIQRGGDDSTWLAAISALLLMVSIGGLGRRCRRGWGTLRIIEIDTSSSHLSKLWKDILRFTPPNSIQTWQDYLNTTVALSEYGVNDLCKKFNSKMSPGKFPFSYTVVSPKLAKPIIVDNFYESYTEAITDFGRKQHRFGAGGEFGGANPRQASPLWVRVLPLSASEKFILSITFLDVLFDKKNSTRNPKRIQKFLAEWNKFEGKTP